jgi:hypothetical protein
MAGKRRAENDNNPRECKADDHFNEVSLRLANIEALLLELLDRRKASKRAAINRSAAIQRRLRDELANHQPSEREMEIARRFLAQER